MVQFYPKPKPQSTFTEKNKELQERLRIKKYGMRGLTVKLRCHVSGFRCQGKEMLDP